MTLQRVDANSESGIFQSESLGCRKLQTRASDTKSRTAASRWIGCGNSNVRVWIKIPKILIGKQTAVADGKSVFIGSCIDGLRVLILSKLWFRTIVI